MGATIDADGQRFNPTLGIEWEMRWLDRESCLSRGCFRTRKLNPQPENDVAGDGQ